MKYSVMFRVSVLIIVVWALYCFAGDLQAQKGYSVKEIDALTTACEMKYLYGTTNLTDGHAISRTYYESDMASVVAEMVKTYMVVGITSKNLYDEDNVDSLIAMQALTETKFVEPPYSRAIYELLELYDEYEKICFNDSSQIEIEIICDTYGGGCLVPHGHNFKWIHKEPTFKDFINFLRRK